MNRNKHRVIAGLIGVLVFISIVGGVLSWKNRGALNGLTLPGELTPGPSSAEATPPIVWAPASLSQRVFPGDSKIVPVSFTASENIGNVVVRVVPELQAFVKADPGEFSKVSKGQKFDLNLIISASASSSLGTFEGAIQIRSQNKPNKTFAKPLPVIVESSRTFKNDDFGVSVFVPAPLLRNGPDLPKEPLAPGGGEVLAYFAPVPSQLGGGDVPTVGGCYIDLSVEDNARRASFDDWLRVQSYRRKDDVDEKIQVAGLPALRRTGIDDITGDPFTGVYVFRDDVVFTLGFSAVGFESDKAPCPRIFDEVLESFRVGE